MAKKLLMLSLGPDGREYDLHGTKAFPCEIYETSLKSMVNSMVPEHWHQEIEIGFVERGQIELRCDETSQVLHEEDIYFISSHKRHAMKDASLKPVFYSVVFHEALLSGPDSINDKYVYPVLHDQKLAFLITRDPFILKKLKDIIKLGEDRPMGFELLIRNQLSSIILCLHKKYRPQLKPAVTSGLSARIEQMLSFIASNYMEDIQVKDVAESAHISSRECYRTFRRELGRPPTVYIHQYRLKKAADLLVSTDMKIEAIARNCGYIRPGYFSTKFKAVYEYSPAEYRTLNQNENQGDS